MNAFLFINFMTPFLSAYKSPKFSVLAKARATSLGPLALLFIARDIKPKAL